MSHTLARRRFLAQSASVAACAAAAAACPAPATAIEPIKRDGESQFKFSVAAYSYRRLLSGKDPKLTLSDSVDDCAKFGVHGTELTSYYFPDPVTPDYLRSLKQQCFRMGLSVSGTAVRNDFCHPEGEKRRENIEHVKQWVDYAEILGAPVIRIFAGKQQKGVSEEATHRLMVEGIEQCCDYAGRHGVHLALENHGGPTSTAEGLLSIVRDVKSDWFGVNLDTGNFHTGDLYEQLARCAPYAINVQVKVVVSDDDGKRPADFERMADILRKAAYRGWVVLEYEESGDPRVETAKHLEEIRKAFS